MALIASLLIAHYGAPLIQVHSRAVGLILDWSGIPNNGNKTVDVFPGHWSATVPLVLFPSPKSHPVRTGILFFLSAAALAALFLTIPLSRSFVVFLAILLCGALGAIVFDRSLYFDSAMYQQIWLRGELLVWILLPWISTFLFLFTLPSLVNGLAWSLLLQIYALIWSAVRLGFCLGVFHHTGFIFLPLLWFSLGTLFDLAYVVLFYSLSLHFSFDRILGYRRT